MFFVFCICFNSFNFQCLFETKTLASVCLTPTMWCSWIVVCIVGCNLPGDVEDFERFLLYWVFLNLDFQNPERNFLKDNLNLKLTRHKRKTKILIASDMLYILYRVRMSAFLLGHQKFALGC